ncbi:MAG: exported protein of unknown function [Candidatus Saccharibacteria bacterium]|nr:exported protein of unknown function [Candidatus Saccharibacteria bacterium]
MYLGVLHRSRKFLPFLLLLGVLLVLIFLKSPTPAHAATGINQQINFQGRLLTSSGATVPDGFYNIQFKIYQDGDGVSVGDTTGSPAGALKWTESYLNNNTQGVQVINGFMSVQLGSITPFGASIDWNQSTLWLSMNIGSTNATCTPFTSCTPDGEMVPMKRMSSSPYALNSGLLGGLASTNFLQLAQGVQTDASTNTNSIYINKTSTGNFLDFQSAGVDVITVANAGDITYGANANHTLSVATAAINVAGKSLTFTGGGAGTGAAALAGGNLVLQGGTGGGTGGAGGNVSIDAGAGNGAGAAGTISIGTSLASTINIGTVTSGTTNVTVGSSSSATGGTTTLQAKASVGITVNGVVRGTFDNANGLYLGNGVTAAAPNNFAISGTGSTTTAVSGGALTIQGGNATVGSANGGNVTISGGTGIGSGVNGLVVLATPTFSTSATDANCFTGGARVSASCTITAASVNNSSAVIVGFTATGFTATLPDPTTLTAGRVVYVTAANTSSDFTLSVNGGGANNTIAMRQNTTATMIWNGADWTAAGASSSTTLQSAYDNTLQSAGGAELIVSHTGNTNGLTIRDSSTNPVNGTLFSVQTASAAGLLSVNGNVTEYSSDSGAEVAGGTSSTFPASTWAAVGSATATRYTTAGNNIATGQGSVSVLTTAAANDGVKNTLSTTLTANTHYNISFTSRLTSGTFNNMTVYYSVDGTTASVACDNTGLSLISAWTKETCSFTAPASGITSSNAILIRQATGVVRTFYVDNLSVTVAANFNYATDGSVDNAANFTTNWTTVAAATVTRSTSVGNDASDSAQVTTTATANQGVRNLLSVNPLPNTTYLVTAYVASSTTGFSTFTVQYSRNGGTSFVPCVDYNTQTVSSSLTAFTEVTCYITTDATVATSPYVYFTQTAATARTFYVDTFSMNQSTNTTPNVQIGGGVNGGPVTLLTLDQGSSAPIANNNTALLGSMYYDTTLGSIQCYELSGWGACGSSPNTVVTISPEFTNAVLHGTGIGTMTSDICSGALGINDGSSSQPTICGTNDTYNFYKWTSPQASAQTYSIYVTYQLPSTFKVFESGQTSIAGRTDSTNSTVQYQIYRSDPTLGLLTCGSSVSVSTGSVGGWQVGVATGAADPSTCSFIGGDSIVFKISVTASLNANAYVGNLNFIFSNQ